MNSIVPNGSIMGVGDEMKTSFKTHHSLYDFKVMPFRITNAPITFCVP
jgi:hypothetical protein